MRAPCLSCVYKHLGDAAIWEMEYHLGYPGFKLYIIGSLNHASTEAYTASPSLAWVIREHRLNWDENPGTYVVPYEALGAYVDICQQLPENTPLPTLPEACLAGILLDSAGTPILSRDTRP